MNRWPFPRRRQDERPKGLDPRWLREARVQLPGRPVREEGPPSKEEPPGAPPPEPPRTGRRLLAVALAVIEAVVLIVLVSSPAFRVREVVVQGTHRMSAGQVEAAAGLGRPGPSVFLVDGSAVRRHLEADVWIRASAVGVELPDRVVITVVEWDPVAAYRPPVGGAVYLNDRGQVLGAAGPDAAVLPQIEGPAGSTASGHVALDPRLLTALVNIQRGLPALIGQPVMAFQLDRCWDLTMVAGAGWRALFGHMLTAADYDSLPAKLSSLKAVAPSADLSDPATYVNLMNPDKPAVGRGQDRPPPPPAPPARHSPPASGAATAAPTATPVAPTPVPNPCA